MCTCDGAGVRGKVRVTSRGRRKHQSGGCAYSAPLEGVPSRPSVHGSGCQDRVIRRVVEVEGGSGVVCPPCVLELCVIHFNRDHSCLKKQLIRPGIVVCVVGNHVYGVGQVDKSLLAYLPYVSIRCPFIRIRGDSFFVRLSGMPRNDGEEAFDRRRTCPWYVNLWGKRNP